MYRRMKERPPIDSNVGIESKRPELRVGNSNAKTSKCLKKKNKTGGNVLERFFFFLFLAAENAHGAVCAYPTGFRAEVNRLDGA